MSKWIILKYFNLFILLVLINCNPNDTGPDTHTIITGKVIDVIILESTIKIPDVKKAVVGTVAVFAAGTSDIPVAEEARIILEELGCKTIAAYDIGIAGIHRVLPWVAKVSEEDADVVIVVAGMEGALASVVKSMVDVPVIGVPTSVGYGYGGGGTSALMSMLQSCSPGITVVNIDNGFGAAAAAYLMCRRISKYKEG